MEDIKELVNVCGSLDREEVIAATSNIRKRAKECLKARGVISSSDSRRRPEKGLRSKPP